MLLKYPDPTLYKHSIPALSMVERSNMSETFVYNEVLTRIPGQNLRQDKHTDKIPPKSTHEK